MPRAHRGLQLLRRSSQPFPPSTHTSSHPTRVTPAVPFVCTCDAHGAASWQRSTHMLTIADFVACRCCCLLQMAASLPLRVFRDGVHVATFAAGTEAANVLCDPRVQPSTAVAAAAAVRVPNSLAQRGAASPAVAMNYSNGPMPGGDYDVVDRAASAGQHNSAKPFHSRATAAAVTQHAHRPLSARLCFCLLLLLSVCLRCAQVSPRLPPPPLQVRCTALTHAWICAAHVVACICAARRTIARP